MPSDLPNLSCESAAETVADEIVVNSRSETQRTVKEGDKIRSCRRAATRVENIFQLRREKVSYFDIIG